MKKSILIMALLLGIGASNFSLAQPSTAETKNQTSTIKTIDESQAVEKAKRYLICHDDRSVDSFGREHSATLDDSGWTLYFRPSLSSDKRPLDNYTVIVKMTLDGEGITVLVLLQ